VILTLLAIGHFASCITGILSGLILTAAGLWAPVPGRRSLGLNYDNATIAIADHDPTSDHPAHRFITNYLGALERNSTFGHGAHIGFVHYARTAPSRHRLVIQPSGNAIGRRQVGLSTGPGPGTNEPTRTLTRKNPNPNPRVYGLRTGLGIDMPG
jgi:hypothetical protein